MHEVILCVGLFRGKRYFYFFKLYTIMENNFELVSFLLLSVLFLMMTL
jgi:hypothetical protein